MTFADMAFRLTVIFGLSGAVVLLSRIMWLLEDIRDDARKRGKSYG